MRILVTGANGQLGNEMQVLAKENPQHIFLPMSGNWIFATNRPYVHLLRKMKST